MKCRLSIGLVYESRDQEGLFGVMFRHTRRVSFGCRVNLCLLADKVYLCAWYAIVDPDRDSDTRFFKEAERWIRNGGRFREVIMGEVELGPAGVEIGQVMP